MSNNLKSLEELTGLKRITKKILLNLCKKNQLYQTPRLNDVLYLHYQGFRDIEELDEYTGLKCLWLECNAISEIKNLTCQPLLKCLFLQNNLVRKIENLNGCPELDTLNLSHNHIANIENCGIDILPVLTNLNLANNYIRTYDGLKGLLDCKMLSVLDLSNNRIEDVLCVKIFSNMPELRVLILQGNPVIGHIPQYRKTLILECDQLTYLDSRPVFPKDRACAEAWKRGGYEEEIAEHERWIKEDQRKMRENVNSLIRLRNSVKNGKQQEVKLLTSDDENVKTDDETSSGSSSDTNLAESLSEKETETDNEKNNNNDHNLLKDIPEENNTTNEEESSENLVQISNTLTNSEQHDLTDKEERDTSDALKKFRKKESEKTIRKCKEYKKSNENIWPKKYLLCEEPETILASGNIFDEKLHVSNVETESSPKIVEQILHKIISDIKISQELEKPPQLELKNDFPKIQPEENQNKNLEIEDILEAKYFDDLIDELKSPIVLEEQNDNETAELDENETAQLNENETAQLYENEEFTPEEFNDMMDILKQNQNETCAANNVTSMDPIFNIPDTGLELTSSEAVCDENFNDILTSEDHENSIESRSLDLTQNNITDIKEAENPKACEACEKLQEEIVTLKEREVEENVPIISYRTLSDQVKNKIAGLEEFEKIDLTEDQKSFETQKPLEQMHNEINATVNDEKILAVGLENKSSLSGLENSENLKEELGLTEVKEENQCKLMKINTEDQEKYKQNFNLMEENQKEIVEIDNSEEAQKTVDLNVEETFCSLPSEQSEHIISETDEYEEFKETKELFSSDDENFKTSSDFDSHLDSDSDTDTDNENVGERNLNTMNESLKEMAESLNEIEKDLKNQMNFEEQLNEGVCYSKHMRVTRSEMNKSKCKANKLSNNRDWLRKYLLQEEPEDVLATSISYHKTLIDFPLKWNQNADENQTAPPTDMNFIEEVNDSFEFQSCSSILEEIQKNISEANFEPEHQYFEIKPHEVNPQENQPTSLEKKE